MSWNGASRQFHLSKQKCFISHLLYFLPLSTFLIIITWLFWIHFNFMLISYNLPPLTSVGLALMLIKRKMLLCLKKFTSLFHFYNFHFSVFTLLMYLYIYEVPEQINGPYLGEIRTKNTRIISLATSKRHIPICHSMMLISDCIS